MRKEEQETHSDQAQPEQIPRALRFLSNIFGHKQSEAVAEQPEPPDEAQTYRPEEEDYLGRLQAAISGTEELAGHSMEVNLLLQGDVLTAEQLTLVSRLQDRAQTLLENFMRVKASTAVPEQLQTEESAPGEEAVLPPAAVAPEGAEEEDAPAAEDACCEMAIAGDTMTVWAFLLPPLFGGAENLGAIVRQELEIRGITFGIDEAMIRRIEDEHLYFKLIPIAAGVLPVDGRDGNVLDLIPRQLKLTYKENEDGTVDFKENNQHSHIKAGDVICKVTSPTDPTPGTDVLGHVREGKPGKVPVVPGGKNTQLNEESTQLIALIDGQVSFINGKFQVDSVIKISGDVDSAVGNLDVIGNVVITGDVLEGFTVKSSADITVSGIVEGAKLVAGGNIQLNRGMNGNQRGIIKTKGTIVAQFLENCTAHARNDIRAQSIINCIVSSDGMIDVSKGRGVIIGGSVTACKSVEAKIIGNASHRVTEVVLGSTPDFLQQQSKLIEEVRTTRGELEETEKNIAYLERGTNLGSDQQTKLTQLRLRRSVLSMQLAKKDQQLDEMGKMLENMGSCFVQSGVIYPGVRITIGLECRPVTETMHSCRIYSGPEGIVFGSK